MIKKETKSNKNEIRIDWKTNCFLCVGLTESMYRTKSDQADSMIL